MDIVLSYGCADYNNAMGRVDKLISLNGRVAVTDNEAQMRPAINHAAAILPVILSLLVLAPVAYFGL
jgi:hypothetical protein